MEATLERISENEGQVTTEFINKIRECDEAIDLYNEDDLVAFALKQGRVFNPDGMEMQEFRREVAGKTLEEASVICQYHGTSVEDNEKRQGRKR